MRARARRIPAGPFCRATRVPPAALEVPAVTRSPTPIDLTVTPIAGPETHYAIVVPPVQEAYSKAPNIVVIAGCTSQTAPAEQVGSAQAAFALAAEVTVDSCCAGSVTIDGHDYPLTGDNTDDVIDVPSNGFITKFCGGDGCVNEGCDANAVACGGGS